MIHNLIARNILRFFFAIDFLLVCFDLLLYLQPIILPHLVFTQVVVDCCDSHKETYHEANTVTLKYHFLLLIQLKLMFDEVIVNF